MHERAAAYQRRAGRRGGNEVRLALERGRSLGAVRQIDERGGAGERVGEAHDRPAMGDAAERAEFRLDQHARRDAVRLGADVLDPQQGRERQRMRDDAVEKRHEPPGAGGSVRHGIALRGGGRPGRGFIMQNASIITVAAAIGLGLALIPAQRRTAWRQAQPFEKARFAEGRGDIILDATTG